MHLDPILPVLEIVALAILVIGIIMHRFKQPYVVIYLITGIVIGPHGLGLITDQVDLSRFGSIGVLLLLFFVGMEISLPRLIASWRIAVVGTLLQILLSIGFVYFIGMWRDWPIARVVLLGFVISLSSTAVVIKILQEWGETDTDVGRDVVGILLVQDLAIIPMLIIIGLMGGDSPDYRIISLQVFGGIFFIAGFALLVKFKDRIRIPFSNLLRRDHELQVFAAFVLCFGLALITNLLHLSSALGAFAAGILLSTLKETSWVHNRLEPFYVVFMAFFFVSVGMLVDLEFIQQRIVVILLLVILSMVLNTFINAFILKILGADWPRSLYAGAFLSQIGEFSFVLAAVGFQAGIVTNDAYNITISVIALTLLLSSVWLMCVKRIIVKNA